MIPGPLLRVLAYVWMAFGACWPLFGLRKPDDTGPRQSRRWRFIVLAVSFAILFLARHAIPPFAIIILGLLWAGLALYWTGSGKAAQSGEFPFYRLLRLLILAVTFALLFWDEAAVGFLGRHCLPQSPAFAVIGFTLALAGMAIALWARIQLGQYWSDKVMLQAGHQLVRTGPYARMRHPIYSGVLLGVLGTAILLNQWRGLVAFAVLLANYAIKAKKEDRLLAVQFHAQFEQHVNRAGFLLPRFRSRAGSGDAS